MLLWVLRLRVVIEVFFKFCMLIVWILWKGVGVGKEFRILCWLFMMILWWLMLCLWWVVCLFIISIWGWKCLMCRSIVWVFRLWVLVELIWICRICLLRGWRRRIWCFISVLLILLGVRRCLGFIGFNLSSRRVCCILWFGGINLVFGMFLFLFLFFLVLL